MRGVGNYVRSLDPARAQQIESKLSPETLRSMYETSPEVWFPISVWKEALDAIVAQHSDPAAARAAVRSVGRFICEGIVNSFLRVLMRIMTPSLFMKKSGAMIGKDFRGFPGGAPDYSYDLSKESEGLLTMTIRKRQKSSVSRRNWARLRRVCIPLHGQEERPDRRAELSSQRVHTGSHALAHPLELSSLEQFGIPPRST